MKKKKYLKPQVDVAQTGPCMMINPSQVKITSVRDKIAISCM